MRLCSILGKTLPASNSKTSETYGYKDSKRKHCKEYSALYSGVLDFKIKAKTVEYTTGERIEPKDRRGSREAPPRRSSSFCFHPGGSCLLSSAHTSRSDHPALALPLMRIRSFHLRQPVFSYSSVPSGGEGSPVSVTSLTLLDTGHSPKVLTATLPCRFQA